MNLNVYLNAEYLQLTIQQSTKLSLNINTIILLVLIMGNDTIAFTGTIL